MKCKCLQIFLFRFTTDVISSIAFGLECNSLKNPEADFRVFGKKCISVHPFKTSMLFFCSTILDILKIPLTPHDATKFFLSVFSEVIDYRRKNYTVRKDFLNLLIQLMDNGEVEDEGDAKNLQKKQNSGNYCNYFVIIFYLLLCRVPLYYYVIVFIIIIIIL